MKTTDMIAILRCEGGTPIRCNNCPVKGDCAILTNQSTYDGESIIAERLEQLLINLRTTQEQLQTIKGERDTWRKRYMRLQNGLKNIVHENDLLDNLMN